MKKTNNIFSTQNGNTIIGNLFERLSNTQIIVLGFLVFILLGSAILALPISSSTGKFQPYIDALFTATSAVSTTGLIVEDTGSYYSLFGQIVILILIQVGGIGYMSFIVLIFFFMRKKLSLRGHLLIQDSYSGVTSENIYRIINLIIIYTVVVEVFGTILYFIAWFDDFPRLQALYLGLFHSISTFCTAGFSLFSNSFMNYSNDIFVNLITFFLCIAGGIGFLVINDIVSLITNKKSPFKFSRMNSHSKLVITMALILFSLGSLLIIASEAINSSSQIHGFLVNIFQAISASSTTGYNSADIALYSRSSLFIMIVFMFIGTAPASTGGGVKSTTIGIIYLAIFSTLRRNKATNIFHRRVPEYIISSALSIVILALTIITSATFIMLLYEDKPLLDLLFETVSAFGTVGLSMGITSQLHNLSKIVIIMVMFIGRIGPLSIGLFFIKNSVRANYTYADGDFIVG
nr:trk/ktr system potassium uptake protein [Candidatus Cloacimonadota bacterium]